MLREVAALQFDPINGLSDELRILHPCGRGREQRPDGDEYVLPAIPVEPPEHPGKFTEDDRPDETGPLDPACRCQKARSLGTLRWIVLDEVPDENVGVDADQRWPVRSATASAIASSISSILAARWSGRANKLAESAKLSV